MSTLRKGLLATAVAGPLGCLLCAAVVASALAGTPIHFQRESIPALEKQLRSHEVHALVFHPNPAPGHIHASLNNGVHMSIVYAASEQAHLLGLAQAEGTPATIATKSTAKKTVHHKLRYIAGGILVAVIVVVAIVLLVDRRRKLHETTDREGGGAPAPSSPGDSS